MLRYERKEYLVDLLNSTDHVNIKLIASQPFSTNTTVSIALENDTATCKLFANTNLNYVHSGLIWLVLNIYKIMQFESSIHHAAIPSTLADLLLFTLVQYVNVTFVAGLYVSTEVNANMLIKQINGEISPSEKLKVTFTVPLGYTNLSKGYPDEAIIVRQSTINTTGELVLSYSVHDN